MKATYNNLFKKIVAIFIIVFVTALPYLAQAQPIFDDDVNDVPIDGGLSVLIAAGVGYGAKKLKERHQKENESE